MSQASSALHAASTMPGYELSVTRAAMMSVTVTEPSKSALLMLDDLSMSGSALKAAAPTAYSNTSNLSTDFISSKVLFFIVVLAYLLTCLEVLLYIVEEVLIIIVYVKTGN